MTMVFNLDSAVGVKGGVEDFRTDATQSQPDILKIMQSPLR